MGMLLLFLRHSNPPGAREYHLNLIQTCKSTSEVWLETSGLGHEDFLTTLFDQMVLWIPCSLVSMVGTLFQIQKDSHILKQAAPMIGIFLSEVTEPGWTPNEYKSYLYIVYMFYIVTVKIIPNIKLLLSVTDEKFAPKRTVVS